MNKYVSGTVVTTRNVTKANEEEEKKEERKYESNH